MSRANTIQTNFTSGELSPYMYSRVDVTKYFNGARKLRNMIVLPQGGVTRVPGTEYLGAVHDATKTVRVRTFTFSQNDSYVLEFGHLTLRIWQSGALIGAPLVVTTPYAHTDIATLKIVQSGDVLFIAHASYFPRVLSRISSSSWTLAEYDNLDGPYLSVTPEATLAASGVVDTAVATASSAVFSSSGSSKVVSALNYVSHNGLPTAKLTITAHGWTTGDAITISGFTKTTVTPNEPDVVTLNGTWYIYALDANTVYLVGSNWVWLTAYTVSSSVTGLKATSSHVEFRSENIWKLARIVSFSSSTVGVVDVVDAAVVLVPTVKLTGGTTQVNSDVAFFSRDMVGKVIRVQSGGAGDGWYLITSFADSLGVYATKLSIGNFNNPSLRITVTDRENTAVLTASAAVFASTDVGREIRLRYGATWVWGEVASFASTTVVTVLLQNEIPFDTGNPAALYNSGITDAWKFGAWSPTTGYPAAVSFHQNRLVWASTTAEPTTKWMTKSGDYYSFEPSNPEDSTVADDNAITITLVSRQVNQVNWLDSGPTLLAGTEGAEWQIKPSSIQQSLTPTNISTSVQTAYGSANLTNQRIGAQTLFIERSGLKLREMSYDFSIDAFASKDLSILSEHILRENSGVVDWCSQTNPYSYLWLVLGNGKLACVTYEKEHEVVAWSLIDVGGTVESCCAVPNATGEDDIYLVVTRTVNGSSVKFVERITRILGGLGEFDQPPCYLNCHKSANYSNVGIDTYTAMDHLVGESVGVVLDGVYLGAQTVQATGIIHIGYVGSVVQAGLPMTSTVGLLDPEGGSQAGTSQGKKKRITESVARVQDSYYFKIASGLMETNDTENLSGSQDPVSGDWTRIVPTLTLATQTAQGTPGTVVPNATFAMISGDVSFSVDDAFDNGARFDIVQDEPYPLTITGLMHKLNTTE